MRTKNFLIASLFTLNFSAFALPVFAQTEISTPAVAPAVASPASPVSTDAMTTGSVVKVNTEQQKVTVKHEAIKNLDMPAMTMVFRMKDAAMIAAVKPGDNIQFHAEKIDGAITITHLQAAK
ncbi:MAG: copper-binding protein [Pseudomonadota bacterium]